ncbi:MAG: hypothetical protein KF833_08100 [Verrucomicrobiae bacterium]|nr:hypothetical protein [Verrucomicrobiae bacterium]
MALSVTAAGLILLLTVVLKGVSVVLSPSAGSRPDLVLPLFSVRGVWIAAIALELAVLALLLSSVSLRSKGYALLWLASVFFVYRMIWSQEAGNGQACPCLGSLVQYLDIPAGVGDRLAVGLLGYLSGVALAAIMWERVVTLALRDSKEGGSGKRPAAPVDH